MYCKSIFYQTYFEGKCSETIHYLSINDTLLIWNQDGQMVVKFNCEPGDLVKKGTTLPYSVLNDFAGLANAALMAWKLTVIKAIKTAIIPAAKNIHQLISIL